ncbi:hypothetical protein CPB97_008940 [Podila verticillata]|nr:hypothetical protein CPB97_008940 [Podila verticillata]
MDVTCRLPPELLAHIGQYLTSQDLASCARVSQRWNEVFIPILWNTVEDSRLIRLGLCSQPDRPSGTPCQEEIDLWTLLTKYGLHIRHFTITHGLTVSICAKSSDVCTNLVSLTVRDGLPHHLYRRNEPHRRSKDMFQKAITRYGYLFPSGHLRHVLLHSASKHPVEVSESPKSMSSLLGSPATWLTVEDEYSLIQAHHLRQLVSFNSRLQKLHLGENTWAFHHIIAPESFYGLLAPLTLLTDFQLPGRGVSLVTLKHVLPRLQSVCFTNADYAVGTLFRVPGWNDPWQLLSDIKYPSLQVQNSNSRVLPIKSLELDRSIAFAELCRILKQFRTIERLGIIGIHNYMQASTVPVQSVQDLINLHLESFRGIKELRIHGVFIPHDYIHRDIMAILPHLPSLHALTIPIRLEDNIAKLLDKSCPHLKTVRTDDYIWPHPTHPSRLQSVVFLLTSFSDLRVVDLVLNQIHVDQLSYDQPWTCLGLEIFRCQISGIERLVKFEQQRYNILVQEERHLPETTGQRTAYEDQIVEQMQRSRRQHQLVYWQLSQLLNLRVLDLGFCNPKLTEHAIQWGQTAAMPAPTVQTTLELSLVSGIDQLRSLRKLEVFGMESLNHRMGKPELKWMVQQWPRLEQMHGLQLQADLSFGPEHDATRTKLRKYLQSLKPSIVHVTQPVKHMRLHVNDISLAFLLQTAVTMH